VTPDGGFRFRNPLEAAPSRWTVNGGSAVTEESPVDSETPQERLLGGYTGRMLLAVSLAWAVLQAGRFLLSPLLPAIITDLGITEATAGIVLALFQGVYAVMQYPSGEYSDRWSRATLVVPGLATLVVGFLLFGLAGGLAGFVLAAVVTGFGKALYAIPSRALLSDLFVDYRGRALGVYAAGTDLGGLAAAGLGVLVLSGGVAVPGLSPTLSFDSWRGPFLPVALVLAGLLGLYALWTRDEYTVSSWSLDALGTVRRLLATPRQRRTLLAFGLFYLMVGGFINFLPTYLAQAKTFSPGTASAAFALVFVVGTVTKPVAGGLSDRFSRELIAIAGLLVASVALGTLVVADSRVVVLGGIVLLAVGYKTEFPLADGVILDNAPDGDLGADLGAARALFLAANAVGPAYVGIVATYLNYTVAFGGLVACLLVAAGLLAWDAVGDD
jgi:MFS family permease